MQIAEPVGFCRVQKNAHVGQFTIIFICAGCIIEKTVIVHFQAYIRTFFLVTVPVRPDRSIKLNRPVFTGLERFLDRPVRFRVYTGRTGPDRSSIFPTGYNSAEPGRIKILDPDPGRPDGI